jgi:uncharacterized membrane protein YhaH (DUF805 family)
MEWMILPYKRYADFAGRSRRLEYWMFTLFYVLVFAVLIIAGVVGMMPSDLDDTAAKPEFGPVSIVSFALLGLFALGSIIPSIAVSVRRFHDQDKSGWMYLLAFIPYVGGLILLVFMCLEGTRGDNSYGPDPKGDFDASVFA